MPNAKDFRFDCLTSKIFCIWLRQCRVRTGLA
jgi:hypothetical protein